MWRISGEGTGRVAMGACNSFPSVLFFSSDFNLPRERSFFGGQRVHLPELGRGGAKLLLRRHRGGAVDGGGCECLTRSDSLSCFLAKMTDSSFLFSTSHQGRRREDGLRSLASVSGSVRVEADVCVAHANCQDQQVHISRSARAFASLFKNSKKPHPFSCKFVSFPTTSPKFSEDSLPRLSHSVGDFGTKHCGLETRQMV